MEAPNDPFGGSKHPEWNNHSLTTRSNNEQSELDPRIREEFERFYSAKTKEERQAITEEYKRWFNSLSEEEQKAETARQIENVKVVLEGVKANNEELDARRIRENP